MRTASAVVGPLEFCSVTRGLTLPVTRGWKGCRKSSSWRMRDNFKVEGQKDLTVESGRRPLKVRKPPESDYGAMLYIVEAV